MERKDNVRRHLNHLKAYRKDFIRLMDCSEVYGDTFFTKEKLEKLDQQISETEDTLFKLKNNDTQHPTRLPD